MKRTELRPWLQRMYWMTPVIGIVFLLLSPILMPVFVLWHNRSDVLEYYRECMMLFGPFE